MNRRDFSFFAGAASLTATMRSQAQARELERGRDFLLVDPPVSTESAAGLIEVVDFFWYSCPHCNAFEPALESWVKRLPSDVRVRRAPVAFRADFVPQQRLFHALEAMGVVDEYHPRVFHEIHNRGNRIDRDETILAWSRQQSGLDADRFRDLYGSFAVAGKARRSTQLQEGYRVSGVPALGVAGRYYIDGSIAGNMTRALAVVDQLVRQQRNPRG